MWGGKRGIGNNLDRLSGCVKGGRTYSISSTGKRGRRNRFGKKGKNINIESGKGGKGTRLQGENTRLPRKYSLFIRKQVGKGGSTLLLHQEKGEEV